MAISPKTGVLIQADNSIDKWNDRHDERSPPDELNLIKEGKHFGWPYCVGFDMVTPEYKGKVSCRNFEPPRFLIPAHAAPLAMQFYQGEMFKELKGKLIVAFHGLGKNGHRLIAYDVDGEGLPIGSRGNKEGQAALGTVLLGTAASGLRISGLSIDTEGAIWLVDDMRRAVFVLRRDRSEDPRSKANSAATEAAEPSAQAPEGWDALVQSVLRPRCSSCHEVYKTGGSADVWRNLVASGLIDPSQPEASPLRRAIDGEGRLRMPPRQTLHCQIANAHESKLCSGLSRRS